MKTHLLPTFMDYTRTLLVLFLVQTSFLSFALAALLIVVDIVIYYPFLKGLWWTNSWRRTVQGKANDELKKEVVQTLTLQKQMLFLQKLE